MLGVVLIFLAVAIGLPLVFMASIGNGFLHPSLVWGDPATVVLHATLITWVAMSTTRLCVDRNSTFSIMQLSFNLFYLVFFLLVPSLNYANNIEYSHVTLNFSDESYTQAYAVLLLSYAGFEAGSWVGRKFKTGK
jgi:hypothetical protein